MEYAIKIAAVCFFSSFILFGTASSTSLSDHDDRGDQGADAQLVAAKLLSLLAKDNGYFDLRQVEEKLGTSLKINKILDDGEKSYIAVINGVSVHVTLGTAPAKDRTPLSVSLLTMDWQTKTSNSCIPAEEMRANIQSLGWSASDFGGAPLPLPPSIKFEKGDSQIFLLKAPSGCIGRLSLFARSR